MTKRTIVFDVDEVLGRFNQPLCQLLAEVLNDPNCTDDYLKWNQFSIDQLYPQIPDFKEVFLRMEREGLVATMPVYEQAREACNLLSDIGNHMVAVTARAWMDNPVEVTQQWFKYRDIHIDELIIAPYRGSKRDSMPPNTYMYFDDNAQHLIDCADIIQFGVLINKPWNAQYKDLPSNVIRLSEHRVLDFCEQHFRNKAA